MLGLPDDGHAARGLRGGGGMSGLPLEGVKVLDLSQAAARRVLLAAAGRLRRRGPEGRGHGHGRLRPLGAAALRGRGGRAPSRRCSFAEPQQDARSASTSRPSEGREVLLRLARESTSCSSPSAPACSTASASGYERLREENPGLVYCAISGYGQDGPLHRPLRPRHELPRPDRAARADRREGRRRRSSPAGRSPTWAAAALMAAFGILAALRERDRSRRGPVRRRLDGRRRAVLAGHGRRALLRRRTSSRSAATSSSAGSLVCYRPYAAPTAGSRSAPWSRSSGRPGAGASAART